MTVGIVLDEVFLGHRARGEHPERPERLAAVARALSEHGLASRGSRLPTRAVTPDEIGRVHTAGYLADLEREVPGRTGHLDEDTFFSPGTWPAALAAAGGAVDLTLASIEGRLPRGLAVVRPPGHHATPDHAMGFCLLNNVGIAAAAARAAGVPRVAIVDWDVHHGNGTQDIFYSDPNVLFVSTHQWPLYPGTGASTEVGAGAGAGTTVNLPLPAGSGDAEYAAAFDEVIVPALRAFRPELILVSAGFDAFVDDPIAGMDVTVGGFAGMARSIRQVADELCQGRMVCVLEGGYDLAGTAAGALATFDCLSQPDAGAAPAAKPEIMREARLAIEATKRALTPHHPGVWPGRSEEQR
jgi:acetoin utilization deacetylase AcuC-like enzyme